MSVGDFRGGFTDAQGRPGSVLSQSHFPKCFSVHGESGDTAAKELRQKAAARLLGLGLGFAFSIAVWMVLGMVLF